MRLTEIPLNEGCIVNSGTNLVKGGVMWCAPKIYAFQHWVALCTS